MGQQWPRIAWLNRKMIENTRGNEKKTKKKNNIKVQNSNNTY